MSMTETVKNEIQGILNAFMKPESLDLVTKAMFKRHKNLPSDKWSLLNRINMILHNTVDARGPKAWIKEDRRPLKGGFFNILGPSSFPKKDKNGKKIFNEDGKPVMVVTGFRAIKVWPVEKTEGQKEVDYGIVEELPEFLCEEVADEWGIKVTQGFENSKYMAYYNDSEKEIKMATTSQQTFFHELAHAAEEKIFKDTKGGQVASQEIIAEFSSVVLMRLFGLQSGTKNTYDYIKKYAECNEKDIVKSVAPFISRIEKVVNLIMETNEKVTGLKVVE